MQGRPRVRTHRMFALIASLQALILAPLLVLSAYGRL
jgi:hypothetical protein